jgi:hypothetical protein
MVWEAGMSLRIQGWTVEFTRVGSMHPESHSAYVLAGSTPVDRCDVSPKAQGANPFMDAS